MSKSIMLNGDVAERIFQMHDEFNIAKAKKQEELGRVTAAAKSELEMLLDRQTIELANLLEETPLANIDPCRIEFDEQYREHGLVFATVQDEGGAPNLGELLAALFGARASNADDIKFEIVEPHSVN